MSKFGDAAETLYASTNTIPRSGSFAPVLSWASHTTFRYVPIKRNTHTSIADNDSISKMFPHDEIMKSKLQVKHLKLTKEMAKYNWGPEHAELPSISMEEVSI